MMKVSWVGLYLRHPLFKGLKDSAVCRGPVRRRHGGQASNGVNAEHDLYRYNRHLRVFNARISRGGRRRACD